MSKILEKIEITWEAIRPRTWRELAKRKRDRLRDVWRTCTTKSGYLYKSNWVNFDVAQTLAREWNGWIEYAPTRIILPIEEVVLTNEDLAREQSKVTQR